MNRRPKLLKIALITVLLLAGLAFLTSVLKARFLWRTQNTNNILALRPDEPRTLYLLDPDTAADPDRFVIPIAATLTDPAEYNVTSFDGTLVGGLKPASYAQLRYVNRSSLREWKQIGVLPTARIYVRLLETPASQSPLIEIVTESEAGGQRTRTYSRYTLINGVPNHQ